MKMSYQIRRAVVEKEGGGWAVGEVRVFKGKVPPQRALGWGPQEWCAEVCSLREAAAVTVSLSRAC